MFFTFVHLGNSIVVYEISFINKDGSYDGDILLNLWLSTFTCISLLVTLNYRYCIYLKWAKMKTYLIEAENLYTSGLFKYMIIESLITLIGP